MISQSRLGRASLFFLAMGIYTLMAIFFGVGILSTALLAVALFAVSFPKLAATIFVWFGMVASMVFILLWILA